MEFINWKKVVECICSLTLVKKMYICNYFLYPSSHPFNKDLEDVKF